MGVVGSSLIFSCESLAYHYIGVLAFTLFFFYSHVCLTCRSDSWKYAACMYAVQIDHGYQTRRLLFFFFTFLLSSNGFCSNKCISYTQRMAIDVVSGPVNFLFQLVLAVDLRILHESFLDDINNVLRLAFDLMNIRSQKLCITYRMNLSKLSAARGSSLRATASLSESRTVMYRWESLFFLPWFFFCLFSPTLLKYNTGKRK